MVIFIQLWCFYWSHKRPFVILIYYFNFSSRYNGQRCRSCIHAEKRKWTFCQNWFLDHRSTNTGLLEDKFQMRLIQSQLATESESLPRTLLSLDPSSGTTWRDNTKLEDPKVKSFQLVRFSRENQTPSRTMESCLDILQVPVSSTCTKSIEMLPFAEPSPKCTVKWLEDTVPEETPSISSKLSFNQTQRSSELEPPNTHSFLWNIQRSPTSRELQLTPRSQPSLPPDQQRSEQRVDERRYYSFLETRGPYIFAEIGAHNLWLISRNWKTSRLAAINNLNLQGAIWMKSNNCLSTTCKLVFSRKLAIQYFLFIFH